MLETAIKEDLILDKNLITPENKLNNLRILAELHPVIGGQPTHEKNQPNDNNPILDLACTIAHIFASGIGKNADLRDIQDEPPSFWLGKGLVSGISSLLGRGTLIVNAQWSDKTGFYAVTQYYQNNQGYQYRHAVNETTWGPWILFLTEESDLEYTKIQNVPITSTLSDQKNLIASIYAVNQVNKATVIAQKTAIDAKEDAQSRVSKENVLTERDPSKTKVVSGYLLEDALDERKSYASKQNRAWARFMKKLKVSGGAKINCVGTSNTSKNKGHISYPEALSSALNDVFRNNVTVTNMGISGGTVASNYNRWKDNTPNADLTIMEFTANDQARTEIGKFVDDLEKYIEYELDQGRAVLLITAPKTDTTININRDVYSAAMYGIANKYSIYILDTEKLFANYSMSIHYDAIHANSDGGTVLGYKIAAVFTGEGIHNAKTVSAGSTLLGRPTLDSLIFGPNTRQFQGSERDPITPNETDMEKGVTANFAGQLGEAYLYYAFYAESDNLFITPNIKLYPGVEVIFTLDGGTVSPRYSMSNSAAIDPSIKISKDNTYSYKNTSNKTVHNSSENNLIQAIPLVTAGWHLLKIEAKSDIAVLYGLEFDNARIPGFLKFGIGGRSKVTTLEYLFNSPETGNYYTLDIDPNYVDLTPEGRAAAYITVEKYTDLYIKLTWSYSIHSRNTYEIRKENGVWQQPILKYSSNNSTVSKDGFVRAQGNKEVVTIDALSDKPGSRKNIGASEASVGEAAQIGTNAHYRADEAVQLANAAQKTANTGVANAKTAQTTADTGVANAKTAQARADAAFTRVKPITEGGHGATTAAQGRKNMGHGDASTRNVAATLDSNGNTLVPLSLLQNSMLGIGQKWVDVTGQRVADTPYTNTTGKPIFISVWTRQGYLGTQTMSVFVDDVLIAYADTTDASDNSITLIIPANSRYKVVFSGFKLGETAYWFELR